MEEALIKRIPPHSIEAEQSVIGAMLLDRDAILIASEILTSDDFYQNQYGIIFDAMVELCNEGKPVDLITLQNRLKEKDLPPDISSMEYVRELIEAVPTSANVKYYANIVSEKALLRRLIKATEDVANTCYLEKESTETVTFFCHFAISCVLLSHLWNVSPFVLWHGLVLAPTSVTEVVTEEREQGIAYFRGTKVGDISHLYAGGEEPAFAARFCEVYSNEDQRH